MRLRPIQRDNLKYKFDAKKLILAGEETPESTKSMALTVDIM